MHSAGEFNAWIERLEAASNVNIATLNNFLEALTQRHDYFHALGGRLLGSSIEPVLRRTMRPARGGSNLANARAGNFAGKEESEQFAGYLLLFFSAGSTREEAGPEQLCTSVH